MGLFDIIFLPKKIENAKNAVVAKYIFTSLDRDVKDKLIAIVEMRMLEGGLRKTFSDLSERQQYAFLALAMGELSIDPGLKKFKWTYFRNPLIVESYSESIWTVAKEMICEQVHKTIDI